MVSDFVGYWLHVVVYWLEFGDCLLLWKFGYYLGFWELGVVQLEWVGYWYYVMWLSLQ